MKKKEITLYIGLWAVITPLLYFSFFSGEEYEEVSSVEPKPKQTKNTNDSSGNESALITNQNKSARSAQAIKYKNMYATAELIKSSMAQVEDEDFVSSMMLVRAQRAEQRIEQKYYEMKEKIAKK